MTTGDESPGVTRHSAETDDVTERGRTEVEATGSERQYQDLVESLDAIVWEINASDFRFTFVSKQSERLLGYSPERWLAELTWQDLIHPDDLDYVFAICGKAIEEGQNHDLEYRMIAADGRVVWIRDIATVVVDGDRPTKVRGVLLDISERERAEEALRHQAQLLANVNDAVVAADTNFIWTSWNPAAERMYGWKEDEVIGRPSGEILHPEFIGIDAAEVSRILRETGHWRGEVIQYNKDGGKIYTEANAFALRDENGDITGYVSVDRDITEHRRAEEALRKAHDELEMRVQERTANLTSANVQLQREISERKRAEEATRLQSDMMKNMAEAVYLIRASDGVIVYTNPAFEKLFGYDPGEMDGKHVSVVNAPTDKSPEETAKEIIAALDSTGAWSGEVHNIQKDGTPFWCYANVSTFDHAQHGQVWVTYHTDITERKRAEESLRESEERFRQLAENVAEVSWLIDNRDDYRVLYVSPAYETIWGRTCKSLYDEPSSWLDAVHPEDLERVSAANETLLELGEFDEEFRVVQPDGTVRYVWDRTFPLRDESGEVYRLAGVVVDITERRRAEEALQVAREVLEGKVERQMLRRNPYGLTFRELTVLHLVAAGKTAKEIGSELGISPLTAQKHISNILAKMDAASRTEAVARGLREGLLD